MNVLSDLAIFALGATLAMGASPAKPAVTVHIKGFKYAPSAVTVHVGDRVTFINDDDEAHTVTALNRSFDSQGMDTNGQWQHRFSKPGTYVYFCELHPYMKATIVVLPRKNK